MEPAKGENAWLPGDTGQSRHQKENSINEGDERIKEKLRLWGLKIDDIAARTQRAGDRARFDILMHIDELKALHAIAQSKFDELRSGKTTDRTRLEAEVKSTLNDLEDTLRAPPRRR